MPHPPHVQFVLVLLVFVGGGLGSVARYLVNMTAVTMFGMRFPWGTFAVNVIGSAAMGAIAGWLLARTPGLGSDAMRLFFMTGILGGFTTFSAYALDTFSLWERGAAGLAILYAVASVVVSLVVLVAALLAVRHAFVS